jgi:hypothetical protein
MSAFKSDVLARVVSELSMIADDGDGTVSVAVIEDVIEDNVACLVREIKAASAGFGFTIEEVR